MSDQVPNEFLMIGLHKLAAERGDGFIPELAALYADHQRLTRESGNVVRFPEELTSPASAVAAESVVGNDNVIAFKPYLAQKVRMR